MPKKRDGEYLNTSIQIRVDLAFVCDMKGWTRREIMEKALLSMITPEDLAYFESMRLERELDKKRREIEKIEIGGGKI